MSPYRGTSQSGDGNPTGRLILDPPAGVEVPTVVNDEGDGGIEVTTRKGGTADIQRVGEAHVPTQWAGEEITEVTDVLTGGKTTTARIDVLDEVTEEYSPVHFGFVRAIGASGTVMDAQRLIIADLCELLQSVGAFYQYDGASLNTVLADVTNDAKEATQLLDSLPFRTLGIKSDEEFLGNPPSETTFGPFNLGFDSVATGQDEIVPSKTFRPNRHDLTDILDWVCEVKNARWWVEPLESGGGVELIVGREPNPTTFKATNLADDSGDITILANNALYQLSPKWQIKAVGVTDKSILAGLNPNTSRSKYPYAVAQHTELAERIGDPPHPEPPQVNVDAKTVADSEKAARKALKEQIDSAAGGEMITLPASKVRPYHFVAALPACDGQLARQFDPITYEVEEVIHDLTPPTASNNTGERTLIRCGLPASDDYIEVVDSGMVDMKGNNQSDPTDDVEDVLGTGSL